MLGILLRQVINRVFKLGYSIHFYQLVAGVFSKYMVRIFIGLKTSYP
jgi:hypothetical protein